MPTGTTADGSIQPVTRTLYDTRYGPITTSIQGQVTSEAGAPIPGATVTVTDTRTLLVEGLKLAGKTFQAARAALASHSAPIVVGALPFDLSKPAALIRPQDEALILEPRRDEARSLALVERPRVAEAGPDVREVGARDHARFGDRAADQLARGRELLREERAHDRARRARDFVPT